MHPVTGEMDIRVANPQWDSSKHFLVTVLTYLKRIFYVKDYKELSLKEHQKPPNQQALQLFQTEPEGYRRWVQECMRESQRSVYLNDPGCTLKFSEEDSRHDALKNITKEQFGGNDNEG